MVVQFFTIEGLCLMYQDSMKYLERIPISNYSEKIYVYA